MSVELTESACISLDNSSPYRILDTQSLKYLANSEGIELGAHTHNHYVLSRISRETQKSEIGMSKAAIESMTSKPCKSFAYPNGQLTDFDNDTLAILEEFGFESAVTAVDGLCRSSSIQPMQLPRIRVDGRSSFSQFKLGLFDIPGRFRN